MKHAPGRRLLLEVLLVLAATAPITGIAAWRAAAGWRGRHGTDFDDFYQTVRAGLYETSQPAFSPDWGVFNYHPFVAVLMAPFGLLPPGAACAVFVGLSVALFYVALRALLEQFAPAWPREQVRIGATSVALVVVYLVSALLLGQFEVLLLALLVFAWLALEQRHDLPAGVLLAAATLLKAYPGLLLVWLLLKRRWHALGGAVLGLLVGGVLLPALMFGPRQSLRLQSEWYQRVVVGNSALLELTKTEGHMFRYSIEALPITLRRYLTPQVYDNEGQRTINFVSIPNDPIPIGPWQLTPLQLLYVALAAGITGIMFWLTWRPDRQLSDERRRLEYAFVILVALLLSPTLWGSRYFALTWPAWALFCRRWLAAEQARQSTWPMRLVVGVWLVSLCLWTDRLRAYSVHLGATILLAIWLAAALARNGNRPTESSGV